MSDQLCLPAIGGRMPALGNDVWEDGRMRVVVIRHHDGDSAGLIGAAFEARGAELSVTLFPKESLPALAGVDHVVVLGAVWSVYDDSPDRAWIADELAWLRRADEAAVPVLGICFGAQALSAALGGRVEAAVRKEVGWSMVESYDPELIPPGPWLEFHGDRCLPPQQARVLARNEVGVQAFSLGKHLAVQFHPEADGEQLKLWMDGGGREEAEQAGTDPDRFLAETFAEEPAARARADALVASALLIADQAR
jgi:GMP synthase-like glutamine amidotransferase